jgi:parallel beta-helix repeat protein
MKKEHLFLSIGVWETNGVPITNNVVYKTYESAIVVTGQNNIVQNNLVSTIYWSGTAQPQIAEFNVNYDGAIMSRDAISVVMRV